MNKLDRLKTVYDRVLVLHNRIGEEKGTKVVLVKGLKLYIGESKLHANDVFNRRLGRTIAQGRAEFASKLDAGLVEKRKTSLSYVITCKDNKELDNALLNYITNSKKEN